MVPSPARVRAAQYLRMSTEHQNYSLTYQTAVNTAYAVEHGLHLVRTYVDAGISGLRLESRAGLKSLLADVVSGAADFETILVYDVSRWGRFQDPDESAHYEFLCRSAGISVVYCAEPFANDGSLASTLVKQIKRAMAAEFSRELSAKVRTAQRGLAALGFWQGGPVGYGLRRQVIRKNGGPGRILEPGEHGRGPGEHIRLVLGPEAEVAVVRRIFSDFVVGGRSIRSLAAQLNTEGVPAGPGARWTSHRVRSILTSEKYTGSIVRGRIGSQLTRRFRADPEDWTVARDAFPAIVPRERYLLALRNSVHVMPKASDEQLLGELRLAWKVHGRLSAAIIDDAERCHCAHIFRRRFGGLRAAYRLIGYENAAPLEAERPPQVPGSWGRQRLKTDEALIQDLRELLASAGYLSVPLIRATPGMMSYDTYHYRFGGLRRAYALAGYKPSSRQDDAMDRGRQSLSRHDAREALRSGPKPVPPAQG